MTGKELKSLMRRHRVTIRELSIRIGVTQKRIRFRRERGFAAGERGVVRDWKQGITGVDPGPQ